MDTKEITTHAIVAAVAGSLGYVLATKLRSSRLNKDMKAMKKFVVTSQIAGEILVWIAENRDRLTTPEFEDELGEKIHFLNIANEEM